MHWGPQRDGRHQITTVDQPQKTGGPHLPNRGTCLLGQGGPHTRHIQKGEREMVVSFRLFFSAFVRWFSLGAHRQRLPLSLCFFLSLKKSPSEGEISIFLSLYLREALEWVLNLSPSALSICIPFICFFVVFFVFHGNLSLCSFWTGVFGSRVSWGPIFYQFWWCEKFVLSRVFKEWGRIRALGLFQLMFLFCSFDSYLGMFDVRGLFLGGLGVWFLGFFGI